MHVEENMENIEEKYRKYLSERIDKGFLETTYETHS